MAAPTAVARFAALKLMLTTTTTTTTSTTCAATAASAYTRIYRAKHCQPVEARHEMLLLQKPVQPPDARILKVAIIGAPNAGKSTLINSLIGQRICSVSSKVHTTRSNTRAVLTRNTTQIVFLDTPGMVSHVQGRKHQLARSLLVDPKNSLEEADLAVVLLDAANKWTCEKISTEILTSLSLHPRVPSILVLNKMDLVSKKEKLFKLVAQLTEGVVGGSKFTMDDRSAQNLGKVGTRPLLSHRYKPRSPENSPSSSNQDNAESSVETARVDENIGRSLRRPQNDESGDGGQSERRSGNDGDASANAMEPENKEGIRCQSDIDCLEQEAPEDFTAVKDSENIVTTIPDDASTMPRISETMQDYLNTLEQYTFHSGSMSVSGYATNRSVAKSESETAKAELRNLLRQLKGRRGWDHFEAVFMVSAGNGEGIGDLQEYLMNRASLGDWEYHEDVVSDRSPEEIMTEAIREKLLEYLPQEVPYNLKQMNEIWTTDENGTLRIIQKIIVNKKSHEKMLMHHIRQIAQESEKALQSAFNRDVHLTLRIKQK